MRWIVCLLLVSMWLLGQFTGFSIAEQPHLPLIGAAALVFTRQRHAIAPALPQRDRLEASAPHATPVLGH